MTVDDLVRLLQMCDPKAEVLFAELAAYTGCGCPYCECDYPDNNSFVYIDDSNEYQTEPAVETLQKHRHYYAAAEFEVAPAPVAGAVVVGLLTARQKLSEMPTAEIEKEIVAQRLAEAELDRVRAKWDAECAAASQAAEAECVKLELAGQIPDDALLYQAGRKDRY
jgi:hypothetical protein